MVATMQEFDSWYPLRGIRNLFRNNPGNRKDEGLHDLRLVGEISARTDVEYSPVTCIVTLYRYCQGEFSLCRED